MEESKAGRAVHRRLTPTVGRGEVCVCTGVRMRTYARGTNMAWKCINCGHTIREDNGERADVTYVRRPGGPGWDGYCRACGELAHRPKAATPVRIEPTQC